MPLALCPDDRFLELFVLGKVAEEEATRQEQHLSTCPDCATRMQRIRTEDPLVRSMRGAQETEVAFPELLQRMVPLFKCLRPAERTLTLPGNTETVPAGFTFSFFSPPGQPGDIGRLGRYRILEILGAGGMGMVFRAHDERLRRDLAVKVIKPNLGSRPQLVEQFLREARAAAAVEHENIVTIYEANEENGVPYLAMPLLRGITLENRLQHARGPLPIEEVLHLAHETASGLAAAHERGLVHRDIKPGNLWVERSEDSSEKSSPLSRIKILDFGLAQGLDEGGLTSVAGTPAYMAPEQAQGKTVDGRADLFSLGCVLYRAVTGKAPFQQRDPVALMIKVASEPHTPVRDVNPTVPPELVQLIDRLLAKRPEDRIQTAREVVEVVEAIQERRREAARPWLARQGWMVAAVAGVAAAVMLWAWLGRDRGKGSEARPTEVTFAYDDPEVPLELVSGEQTWNIEPGKEQALSLPPGEYLVRASRGTKRRLLLDRFTVQSGEPKTIRLNLVGPIREHTFHTGAVNAVALFEDQAGLTVYSAGQDRRVCRWNALKDGPAEQFTPRFLNEQLEMPFPPLLSLALSSDGKRVIFSGGDLVASPGSTVYLWEVLTRKRIAAGWVGLQGLGTAVTFIDQGRRFLVASSTGVISCHETETSRGFGAKFLEPPESRPLGIEALAVSPEGHLALLACGDGTIRTLELRQLIFQRQFDNAHKGGVTAVAYLPESRGFVSAGKDGLVRIWDGRALKPRDLKGHKGEVRGLAVSSDGTRVISGGADGSLRVWSVAEGQELHCFDGAHPGGVNSVTLTRDGKRAVTGGSDRVVRYWQLPH